MPLLRVTRKPLNYGGKRYAVGEEFEATDKHAALYRLTKAAEDVRKAPAALLAPKSAAEPKRRSYKRRDLEAEDSTPAAAPVPALRSSQVAGGGASSVPPAAAGTLPGFTVPPERKPDE